MYDLSNENTVEFSIFITNTIYKDMIITIYCPSISHTVK